MIKIEYLEEEEAVYDITVKDNENFYANDILVHNCAEILLYVKELKDLYDEEGEIALCILTNTNAGKLKSLDELPRLARSIIRGLDNVIDIQEYPLPAAKNSTLNNRYLGVGVSDWSHYLTKHKVKYNTPEALELAAELAEKWQYNLLRASCDLAKERGEAPFFRERSKYADGWLPNDGNFKYVSIELWEELRADIIKYGLRHLVLSAVPPAACQTLDGVIKTKNGDKSLEQILTEQKIDFKEIEKNGIQKWVDFKEEIEVNSATSETGYSKVNKIWYNGPQKTRTIIFEDGTEHTFTLNHRLKCLKDGEYQWIEVGDLTGEEEF